MTFQEIIDSHITSWADRDTYLVTKEEFEILLASGAEIEFINKPNGDDTFFSQLKIQQKHFCYSGRVEINGQP